MLLGLPGAFLHDIGTDDDSDQEWRRNESNEPRAGYKATIATIAIRFRTPICLPATDGKRRTRCHTSRRWRDYRLSRS